MDLRDYQRKAWDGLVRGKNRWTLPVDSSVIARARRGDWSVVLTPEKPVPHDWFPPLAGADVLLLASGGGQQGPIFAALGARVVVFDNSPAQLAQDRLVADREGLEIRTVEGDMVDLGAFADLSFDLVFHPCSNTFVPAVRPVWREAYRILKKGGILLAGFTNPAQFIFDEKAGERGEIVVRHALPYRDDSSLTREEYEALLATGEPLIFSHSLEDQIGGQIEAGFRLTGLYEDKSADVPACRLLPLYIATRAVKD